MPQHLVRHHLNSGILHFGLFTDAQIGAVVATVILALSCVVAGDGLVLQMIVPLLVMTPAVVMVLDNHSGGLLRRWLGGWLAYHRSAGVYEPGANAESTPGYALIDVRAAARAGQPALETLLDD
jgi:hypothetical protein